MIRVCVICVEGGNLPSSSYSICDNSLRVCRESIKLIVCRYGVAVYTYSV